MTLIEKLTLLSEKLAAGLITELEYERAAHRLMNGANTLDIFGKEKPDGEKEVN